MVIEQVGKPDEVFEIGDLEGKPSGFCARNKKALLGGGAILFVVFVVLLGLGLGGVLDPKDSPQGSTPLPAKPSTASATPSKPTIASAPPSKPTPPPPINPDQARLDCKPDRDLSENECKSLGCVFDPIEYSAGKVPKCYLDSKKTGFFRLEKVTNFSQPHSELYDLLPPSATKMVSKIYSRVFGKPQLLIEQKSNFILRLKFFDGDDERYEVPVPLQEIKDPVPSAPRYTYEMKEDTKSFRVTRTETGTVIFDLSLGGLILEDQFLQISTKLPSTYVYGFGENRHPNLRHKFDWRTWPMFSRDQPPTNPTAVDNLYGVHPFYMCVEEDGNAHGIFLLNSNAMEYQFQPAPALTLRSIGGIFDFYIFMGPTPENVVQQYTELLGRMFIPPYWGLGFQISRWGFENLDHVKRIVNQNLEKKIPLDSVYGDIDYMRHRQDFTYDMDTYEGLPEFIDLLHRKGMRYVIILDPAIHVDSKTKHPDDPPYLPYIRGIEDDIFIKWPEDLIANITALNNDSIGENRIMLGKVWPDGRSAFPDFFNPATVDWWEEMIADTYNKQNIKFDALWIDMNEVSSFDTNGDPKIAWYCGKPDALPGNQTCFALQCPKDNKYENPPYKPVAVRNWGPNAMLSDKTVCMVGETLYKNKTHHQYDLHSLYGWSQAEVTAKVAEDVRKKRSFAFSRSTYPGGQQFVGHWLGDNAANFEELRYSLIGLMEFSMFGYGYVGADICGFWDNSTAELCSRWMAAGAFYPFSRNHNARGNIDQDPAQWDSVTKVAKNALGIRYSLLPYLYTLFYRAHVYGDTVSRPLHHEYPTDKKALNTDDQFFWGSALLISPIVQNVSEREVYIPKGKGNYYTFNTGELKNDTYTFTWDGDNNVIAVNLRSGYIIPQQHPATNTHDSRKNDFYLTIVADLDKPVAEGELYWDDGERIGPVEKSEYYLVSYLFDLNTMTLKSTVRNNNGPDMQKQHKLSEIRIYSSFAYQTVTPLSEFEFFLDNLPTDKFEITKQNKIVVIKGDFPMDRHFTFHFAKKGISKRINCAPGAVDISKVDCEKKGCLYDEELLSAVLPSCYFNTENQGYATVPTIPPATKVNNHFDSFNLKTLKTQSVSGSPVISDIKADFLKYSKTSMRFRFTDAGKDKIRYEVPNSLMKLDAPKEEVNITAFSEETDYVVKYVTEPNQPFTFNIKRRSTNATIFDTSLGGFVYEDQFLQITTKLASSYVYGFGENRHNKFRHDMDWRTWPLFARDEGPIDPTRPTNHYGVHPFYIVVEDDGKAHGVFLLNSNAMEYQFQPAPALTLRSLGGIFDFFIFTGPTYDDVVRQYTGLIGRPVLPPYWALGFQVCRWGYKNLDEVKDLVRRMREAKIPQDIQYIELDYMDKRQMFTIDQENFGGVQEFATAERKKGLKFIYLLDPFIHAQTRVLYPGEVGTNPSYEDGLKDDVFIKWPTEYLNHTDIDKISIGPNNTMLGKAWPDGLSAYPDFFKDTTEAWWKRWISSNSSFFEFDGLWIDMNEPVAFETNIKNASQAWFCLSNSNLNGNQTCWGLQCPGGKEDVLDNPPYMPVAATTWEGPNYRTLLSSKTLCMVGEQTVDDKVESHYNVHNLYGIQQSKLTKKIAEEITNKRSWVISRSTFPGSGKYVGHWLGDNKAQWSDMHYSIIGMFEFNMFGIPYVGADICGFFEETTEELCRRWQVLGSFYPMSRNHNTRGPRPQDPAQWPSVASATRKALQIRYNLLPFLYTLFDQANIVGTPVIRPLFSVFYKGGENKRILDIDDQFMWGSAVMFAPILLPGQKVREVFFPEGRFYDYRRGNVMDGKDESRIVPVADDGIVIYVREGHILPVQPLLDALNTDNARKNPLGMQIYASTEPNQFAQGLFYYDDGDSTVEQRKYLRANMEYFVEPSLFGHNSSKFTIKYTVVENTLDSSTDLNFGQIIVRGFSVKNNLEHFVTETLLFKYQEKEIDISWHFHYNGEGSILKLALFKFSAKENFTLTFINVPDMIDCLPESDDSYMCESRGCVWNAAVVEENTNAPNCTYPIGDDRIGYHFSSQNTTEVILSASNEIAQLRPEVRKRIAVRAMALSDNILRISITDQQDQNRYHVPCYLAPFSCSAYKPLNETTNKFTFEVKGNNHQSRFHPYFEVRRKSNNKLLWSTDAGPIIFANQYLEISTRLPSKHVFGLGEHSKNHLVHDFNFKTYGMFGRDQPPGGSENLYGVHPYVMVVEDDEGNAFGSLLLNSNAMEVQFTPTSVMTYRTTGGILDFYLFIGDDGPSSVNQLYMETIGKPYLPPYWALGFQISRYGYNTFENMRAAVERTLNASIPLDVFYGDIDYFDHEQNFLIGDNFINTLPAYVRDQAQNGLNFITILDPCLAANTTYEPFSRALAMKEEDVFIRWPANYTDTNNQSYQTIDPEQPPFLLGHVWPASKSVFVDFFSPSGKEFWKDEVKRFHGQIPFAALWIDMNEPANFGTNGFDVWYNYSSEHPWHLSCPADDPLENLPYKPKSIQGKRLSEKTICLNAVQSDGTQNYSQYDVHNLYGHSQVQPSLEIMQKVTGKRSFILSRSTFVGSGANAGHWLGDNNADWDQLRQSVIGMVEFNLFGIPYVGADICGYFNNTTAELCTRWMQLGAFYPFSRNHNGKGPIDQDPAALGPEVAEASKIALEHRYRLLPYLYTLFYHANTYGATVVRSFMEVFPRDVSARNISEQFMWGNCLLITPVLYEGWTNVTGYFPTVDGSDWFDFLTGVQVEVPNNGLVEIQADLSTIPLHVRSGCILPMQESANNTKESQTKPYSLWIAPHSSDNYTYPANATGVLYWDGGEEISVSKYHLAEFQYSLTKTLGTDGQSKLFLGSVKLHVKSKAPGISENMPTLETIKISGVPEGIITTANVTLLDSAETTPVNVVKYDAMTKTLLFEDLKLRLDQDFELRFDSF